MLVPVILFFSKKVSGTGGLIARAWCGLIQLYCMSQALVTACACCALWNHSAFRTSRLSVPLKRSLYPFSHGLPEYICSDLMPTLRSHSQGCAATNSGPSSERMNSGFSCFINNGYRASRTSFALILERTTTDRASRVYSSMTVSIL